MTFHGVGSRGQELPKNASRFLQHGGASAALAAARLLPKLAADCFSARVLRGTQLAFLSIPVTFEACAPPRRPITAHASRRRSLLCLCCGPLYRPQ